MASEASVIFGLTSQQFIYLLQGAGWTVLLSALGFLGGFVIGLPVALGRLAQKYWLRLLAGAYVQIGQSIPMPVTLFVVYFGISISGFDIPVLFAAALAISLNAGSFLGEIWKGCIESIPKTQWEASDSLALNYHQQMTYVILPQAVRIAIPPTVGFLVGLVKDTSFAVVIGAPELTYSARVVNNTTFEPFVIFTLAAAIYFALCYPLSLLSSRLERMTKRV
jgi:polar amino acid transport system permease protein